MTRSDPLDRVRFRHAVRNVERRNDREFTFPRDFDAAATEYDRLAALSTPPPSLELDRVVAEAAERVKGENADRYVDLRIAVELADTRTSVVSEKDGTVEVYSLRASDWNRVVAVARGHVSKKTRASLDSFVTSLHRSIP